MLFRQFLQFDTNAFLALFVRQLFLVATHSVLEIGSTIFLWCRRRISTNGTVSSLVHLLQSVGRDTGGNEFAELFIVFFFIFIGQLTHVISDMTTENVITQNFSIQRF